MSSDEENFSSPSSPPSPNPKEEVASDDESDYDDDLPLIELYTKITGGTKRRRSSPTSSEPVSLYYL